MGEVRDSGDYMGEAGSLVDIPVKWGVYESFIKLPEGTLF